MKIMTDSYQTWVNGVVNGRMAKPLSSGEIVKSSSGKQVGAIEFVVLPKTYFMSEVGKKGNAYVYHFYPAPGIALIEGSLGKKFYDCLSEAFLDVFKREDQIEADWVEEMQAWAVRVTGWSDNVWGDELAVRAIDRLDEILTGKK